MKPKSQPSVTDGPETPTAVRCRGIVSCTSSVEVGSKPPAGYVAWHKWAEVQYKAGLRQTRCGRCGLHRYPQEMSKQTVTHKATTHKYGGRVVVTTMPICNECAANTEIRHAGPDATDKQEQRKPALPASNG